MMNTDKGNCGCNRNGEHILVNRQKRGYKTKDCYDHPCMDTFHPGCGCGCECNEWERPCPRPCQCCEDHCRMQYRTCMRECRCHREEEPCCNCRPPHCGCERKDCEEDHCFKEE